MTKQKWSGSGRVEGCRIACKSLQQLAQVINLVVETGTGTAGAFPEAKDQRFERLGPRGHCVRVQALGIDEDS